MSITFTLQACPAGEEEELNLTNTNAADLLAIIYPQWDRDCCGEIPLPQVREIHARLMRMINVPSAAACLIKEPSQDGRLYEGGRSASYVQHRLEQFMHLTSLAQKHQTSIVFG